MDNAALIVAEVVSATICFVLLRFMIKPYRITREGRYLGLPLGFGFLGVSYVFMGVALYFESFRFVEEIKWLQVFTQAYAFAFLAVTYRFSKRPSDRSRLWWDVTFAALIFAVVLSYLVVFEPPMFGLPSLKTVDEYFIFFNIICLAYVSIHTLKDHASKPDPKTIWIPLSYLLLGFAQYSSLIWSLDSSFSAFVGAHVLRIGGLLVLLFVAYQTFYASRRTSHEEGIQTEEAPAQR
jgi:hypothetical protein